MLDLKEHQEYGAQWLAERKRALLADEMGVGKSAQAIRACDILSANRITVVCPAIATYNWRREFELFGFYDHRVRIIETGRDKAIGSGVNIVSYNLASTPRIYRALVASKPEVLILDESHFLKNKDTKRTKVVFGNRREPYIVGLAPQSEHTYGLSGTPMPKDPGDLWVPLHHFGAYPKSYSQFEREFCTGFTGDYGFKITGVKNVKRLKALLREIMLRRKLRDIMDKEIPVFIENFSIQGHEVDPEIEFGVNASRKPADERKLNKAMDMVSSSINTASGDEDVLTNVQALKIYRDSPTSTLRRHTGLMKIQSAAEFIKDKLDNYVDNVVVFAIHRDVITGLADALHLYNPVKIWGGMKQNKKDRQILKFERGKSRVAILNIAAGGTAIRFKHSQMVIFAEADWNPDNNAQAISRCLWLEREAPLPVYYLSLANSYDEQVNRVLVRKTYINSAIFE
jgi:SWI/SNF-related matrix-associated actin-dependent regulator 1 of chromatin subfamily A